MNKRFFGLLVSICVCLMSLLQVKAQPNVELITDGSFEQFSASNPVFGTDYTYKGNGGVLPGEYYVGSNSSGHGVTGSLGGGWHDCVAYNGSKFMMVNGYNVLTPTQVVWRETVNVSQGIIYTFKCRVVNIGVNTIYGNPHAAHLVLMINGVQIAEKTVGFDSNYQWQLWTVDWTSTGSTAIIEIFDTYQDNYNGGLGDDFGLDAISFKMHNDYSLTANNFTVPNCGEISEIVLQQPDHYSITYPPEGNSAPPMQVKIRKNSNHEWGTTVPLTNHGGSAYVEGNTIYYTPGDYGQDQLDYQILRFGLESHKTITFNVGNVPTNCTPQGLPVNDLLCIGDVSSFNPSATWEANGSNITLSNWEFKTEVMDYWEPGGNFQYFAGIGGCSIRFFAENSCGRQESDPYNFNICDVPEWNPAPNSTTICTGSAEPPFDIEWNYNTGVGTWQYKRGNGNWTDFGCSWDDFDLLPGDQVRYQVTYNGCSGNPLISPQPPINVVSGPEFISNSVPDSWVAAGYCPNSQVTLPSIQTSWYEDYGMSVTPHWYYVIANPSGSPEYQQINGNTIVLNNGSVSVTPGLLNTECGPLPTTYSPAFDLIVWDEPTIEGLENMPDSLGPVCSGTTLNSILPELSPGGHYLDNGFGWEISSGQSQTGFSSNLPTQLSAGDNGRWLRYRVQKDCTTHSDTISNPIRVWVGAAPTLNTSQIEPFGTVCAGTSLASLVDVHVTDWNLFQDEESFERWEVLLNGTWTELTQFELIHDGCQVRYHAHNYCGDAPFVSAGTVSVTEGPSFNNPGASLGFESYYCDGNTLNLPTSPGFDGHGINVNDSYWAYFDGTEYHRITASPQLDESWNGYQITYVLESDCGGEIYYPTPYTLIVKGRPEVEISMSGSDTFCVDTPIALDAEFDWHLCTQNTQASSWQYAPVDQPNNYSDFDPNVGILEAGTFYINYHAVANECGFDAISNSIRVTVEAAPTFENTGQPFELGRFCEDQELELPSTPSVTGHVENALWRISIGTDLDGEYEAIEPNYLNYRLTLDDNGRWLQYYAIGCNTPIHYELEIHVDGKPWKEYSIADRLCKGQSLTPQLVNYNVYPVTQREWRINDTISGVSFNDPNNYTFNVEGNYSIYYRVGNDCGWSNFMGPLSLTVTAGPEFDNSTLPNGPQYVCVGTTVGEFLEQSGIAEPSLVDPSVPHNPLGWFINGQQVVLTDGIVEDYHGEELRYGVESEDCDVPVYSNGILLYVYGRPEVTQMPPLDWEFCDGDAVHLPDPDVNFHNGEGHVIGQWQIQSNDGSWDNLPPTWSSDHNGMRIRYHLEHTVCDLDNDSEMTISVVSAPIINDSDLPSENLITICFDSPLGIDEPGVQPETYVSGWQVSANGTDWSTQLEGHTFNPACVDNYFNGKYLRYHAESTRCPDLEDNSIVYTIQLINSPTINDANWPNLVQYCSGGSLGIDVPSGLPGLWQVSVDGTNWDTELEGHVFDQNHIDDFFDGKHLCYFVHSFCGDTESKVLTLKLMGAANMPINGETQVAMMNSFWPGIYDYYIDSTNLVQPVEWSLEGADWRLDTLGMARCMVYVSSIGTAVLHARFMNEMCSNEVEVLLPINATYFGVGENDAIEVSIYPNPTRNTVTIEAEGIERIRLINMMGQVLEIREYGELDSAILDLSGYTPSVYLLEVKTINGVAKKRLILYR